MLSSRIMFVGGLAKPSFYRPRKVAFSASMTSIPHFLSSASTDCGSWTAGKTSFGCSTAQDFEYKFLSQYGCDKSTCSCSNDNPDSAMSVGECQSWIDQSEQSVEDSYSDEFAAYYKIGVSYALDNKHKLEGTSQPSSHSTKWMPILNIFLSMNKE